MGQRPSGLRFGVIELREKPVLRFARAGELYTF